MMLPSIEKPYARIGIWPVEHVFNTFLLNFFALKLMATPFFFPSNVAVKELKKKKI